MPNVPANPTAVSKKVFFLYPHGIIQTELLNYLIMAEYEVAIVNDFQKASMIVQRYKSSILFINIETKLSESEWEQFIRSLMANRANHDVRIGILTYTARPDLEKKYLNEIGIQCGFTILKQSIVDNSRLLLKILGSQEARGNRRFVRIACPDGKSILNISHNGRLIHGKILDISVAGMACILDEDIAVGQDLDDIQMQLWGTRMKTKAKVAGARADSNGKNIFVFMFDQNLAGERREKIHGFIRRVNQNLIDTM